MKRRECLVGAALLLAAATGGCKDVGDKPVVRLALGQTVEQVQAQSTYRFPEAFMQGIPGAEMIITPHVFIYDDQTLKLRIDDAGGKPSLPTSIGYSFWTKSAPVINYVGQVAPLDDYVPLSQAIARAKALQAEIEAQGLFIVHQFRNFGGNLTKGVEIPRQLGSYEELGAAFLDSQLYLKEGSVFRMTRNDLSVKLIIVNGRRKWGSRTDKSDSRIDPSEVRVKRELRTMTPDDLRNEPSYMLFLSFGPPLPNDREAVERSRSAASQPK